MVRNTIQRALTLEAVRKLNCHPTAEEIYAEVAREHPYVSRGTVYRNLHQLVQSGEIREIVAAGGAARFDHSCHDHHHAKCDKCGRVFDVDMEYASDLEERIRDAHGFEFTGYDLVFRGVCPDCRR